MYIDVCAYTVHSQEISAALVEKRKILAELSNIDNVDEFEEILEMSSSDENPDAKTLIMHSIMCGEY